MRSGPVAENIHTKVSILFSLAIIRADETWQLVQELKPVYIQITNE